VTHHSFSSCAGRIRHPTGVVPAKGNPIPEAAEQGGEPSRSREILCPVCSGDSQCFGVIVEELEHFLTRHATGLTHRVTRMGVRRSVW